MIIQEKTGKHINLRHVSEGGGLRGRPYQVRAKDNGQIDRVHFVASRTLDYL